MRKKLGMVIVNYNDYETTIRLINNIKGYKSLDLIVIVDNNSTDNSLLKLKEFESKKITIIKNSKNAGYASALNMGAKYVISKLGCCNIIFSNSDIIIKSDADLKLLSSRIENEIAVIGPTIEEHGSYNRGWMMSSVLDEILFNLPFISRYFIKRKRYKSDYYTGNISYVDVVSGCFFIVDGNILEKVSYFDENTFLYYEELIFSKKIKNINKKITVCNDIFVIHDHSVSIDKNIQKINKYKILKTSQRYFVKSYLNANSFAMFFLYITNKLSLLILYIRCFFRREK